MYYLWTLTWGLGWIPLAAIAVGVIVMVRRAARTALLLLSFPLALLALLSLQARYFGRWLLPIYPALAVLAAYGAVQSTYWLVSRRPRLRMTAIMAMATLLCAQGLSSSIHVNAVLGRRDTRELLREWLDENLPRGTQIVVEPFTPRGMFASADRLNSPEEWKRYPAKGHSEIYQQDLEPARIDDYRLAGYCWVVTASYQQERGINEGLEGSLAYYTRLRTEADLVAVFSPYREGDDPVRFNFDLSYNFYPSAYERPGPEIRVYRLRRCEQDMSGGGE